MASTPGFANTPRFSGCVVTTALTGTLDAPTGTAAAAATVLGLVIAAGSSGTRIDEIRAQISVTTASVASTVNLYVFNGTTHFLFDQMTITAVTGSASAETWGMVRSYQNLVIPSGHEIRVTIGASNTLRVTAFGADF